MKWNYFNPIFEGEEQRNDFESPWGGHRYFAYDMISNLKPKIVVELGTYKGTSFFAFCQAVKDQKLDCVLFGIDNWTGDPHSSFYNEDVFKLVNEIRIKYYSGLKINLLRTEFDQAVMNFSDHSIDILHIDGYHTYEAVSNDFNRWYNKVKKNGIILFHDTHEKKEDFGVYKFWDELKTKHGSIEFFHSHGLGVLFKSSGPLKKVLDFQEIWENYYSLQDTYRKSEHIKNQETTLSGKTIAQLELDKINLDHTLQEKENIIREKENNIQEKLNIIQENDTIIKGKDHIILDQDNSIRENLIIIQEKENSINEKENSINEKENIIQGKLKIIKEKENIIQEKLSIIQEKEIIIQGKDQIIREKENSIQEKDKIIQEHLKSIQEKDRILGEQLNSIQGKENIIQENSASIQEKVNIIQAKVKSILEQEIIIREKANSIQKQSDILQKQADKIREKEALIQQQAGMISALYSSWSWKMTYPFRKIISFFQRNSPP